MNSDFRTLKLGKILATATLSATALLSSPFNAFAASNDKVNVASNAQTVSQPQFDYKTLIPKNYTVSSDEQNKLASAVSYGILEAVSRVIADSDNEWTTLFKSGDLDIKKVIPIRDADSNLSQVMLVFKIGYLIVDTDNGTLIKYSYGVVNNDYFNQADGIYTDDLGHFAVANGKVKDGQYSGMSIDNAKAKIKANKQAAKAKVKDNKKWGKLDKGRSDLIIQGYGANEGTSRHNYITDPVTWLQNYYGLGYGVQYVSGYTLNVPEIDQNSSSYPEANDCALVATLEILGYYNGSLTSSQKNTAYSAMKNSSYFSSANGVQWYNNDQIFKIAAESVGWPTQNTSDDPENYVNTNNYNFIYNQLHTYGPGYISLNQSPYPSHTVTFKGVKHYIVSWQTAGAYYSNFEDFVQINDHWAVTPGDAYLNIQGGNVTWYFANIVVN